MLLCLGCAKEPVSAPPVSAPPTWWKGSWVLDLGRMDLSQAPPLATQAAKSLGRSARYELTGQSLARRIADANTEQPWTLRSGDASRVEFAADGKTLAVERRADGVWLVDGAVELPLARAP